ncbi:hypothetical protein ACQKCH_14675 [Nubsella zeaxanthinifaciens]|uniref:hypothetical protein n=1 Tax=Nubsella zeaxanthinifaciens TaxID=392412 RepID=UPI003D070330
MQTKSYYRNVFQRRNVIKDFFSAIFQSIASYPRLTLEVFIKGQFGVRYFSLASVITIAIILAILPIFFSRMFGGYGGYSSGFFDTVEEHKLFYIFIVLFIGFSIKRYREIKQPWGVIDPTKFSLSMGTADAWLINLKFNGKPIDGRYREVFVEPAIFLIIGIICLLLKSMLGPILIIFSIIYCLSFLFAYRDGDNWAMDINDQRISAEQFHDTFVNDKTNSESGFEYRGAKPNSKDDREKIYKTSLLDDDDIAQ